MSATICWAHIGDLHLDAEEALAPWHSRDLLREIVRQIGEHAGKGIDFVYLPGDNANHGTPDQYRMMTEALAPLSLPWRIIPGDHDFEPGDLAAYRDAVPAPNRPEAETIAGHRCLFLDVVSAGAGGPDFRLTMHDRNRIGEELGRAEARGEVPLVFMHAYPGDVAADGDTIARAFADGHVAFVDTGHTHYNELLNDGHVVYGATRSTGQIEEDGGRAGFAIVCVHHRVPSWRFRRLDAAWPHVQILAPCDFRLVTRPADPHQVPRPGAVEVVAKVIGADADGDGDGRVTLRADDGPAVAMTGGADGLWRARVELTAGRHAIEARWSDSDVSRDRIDVIIRAANDIPKRGAPVALGRNCHAIGAWPHAGIDGGQLGPNKNGQGW